MCLIFYLLQLYIAKKLQIEPSTQTHYTDSLHLYEKHFEKSKQSISANLYNKELRKVLVKKIEFIVIDFKISLQDLYFFTQYNSEWKK